MKSINKRLCATLIKLTVILLLLTLIPACTVISETQCRFSDFGEIGYYDAQKGKPRKQFTKYQEKCLTYNIDVTDELVIYDYGRERGLISYCAGITSSRQCGYYSEPGKIKSHTQIGGEMLRLRSIIPPTTIVR